jgi:hypothetical protein
MAASTRSMRSATSTIPAASAAGTTTVGIGAYQVAGPDLDPGDSDRRTDDD